MILGFLIFLDSGIYFWQILLFILISHKVKLQIKLENYRLRSKLTRAKRTRYQIVRQNLFRLDQIYRNVRNDNEFWSKYLFLNWMVYLIVAGVFVTHLFLGRLEILNILFFSYALITMFICMLLLSICAVALPDVPEWPGQYRN
jgi:hypothetical protein